MSLNERGWAGHIIAWVLEAINNGTTLFSNVTNDQGIKIDGGNTLYPDILLYIDKSSGLIFNLWELKFPDTKVDDLKLLDNALIKAKQLKSNSFVTWNGSKAIIWYIKNDNYDRNSLEILKEYPKELDINKRSDLANLNNYNKHVPKLKSRLLEILHDLEQFYKNGKIKEAISISSNIGNAIYEVSVGFIPTYRKLLINKVQSDLNFRNSFNYWKILESSTFKILTSSSRTYSPIDPYEILAKFTYYKLIGKILLYKTLSENLSGSLPSIEIKSDVPIKDQLEHLFNKAKKIDFQAVFENDFTDTVEFEPNIDKILTNLFNVLENYDFKYLPSEVTGNILENLISPEEKQKFGQYFTPYNLALLVSVSAIKGANYVVFDPTSGTGSFLTAFYQILKSKGVPSHKQLLNQIWGNDISDFPAVLSVISLYKQKLEEKYNFPRVKKYDYFDLLPGKEVIFPSPDNTEEMISIPLPQFDAIVSNFPFIQQEDIPKESLVNKFKIEFNKSQKAFETKSKFTINERSDYYVYCFYNSLKFLKNEGYLAAITSNAWLGKNYGDQFKQFLLDNFSIRYVVRSNSEHWFKDSQVSTIFITLQKKIDTKPIRFVTINFKVDQYFQENNIENSIEMMEDLYNQIDYCESNSNKNFKKDNIYDSVYHSIDGKFSVSIIQREHLINQIKNGESWGINFLSQNPFKLFNEKLVNPFPKFIKVGRGTRTGWDKMHILKKEDAIRFSIESDFLLPILKNSKEIKKIHFNNSISNFLFVCNKPINELKTKYPNAFKWIKRMSIETNEKGKMLIEVFKNRTPYWYSLEPELEANIFISINLAKRIFFSYTKKPIHLNQRLIAIRANKNNVKIVTALLNSIISLLYVEINGIPRNLGALDLNADFFKTKMKILDFSILRKEAQAKIIDAFDHLAEREILEYDEELLMKDRIKFDEIVLSEFGYDRALRKELYSIFSNMVTNRIEMRNR